MGRKRGFTATRDLPSGRTQVVTTDREGSAFQEIKEKLAQRPPGANLPGQTPANSFWRSRAAVVTVDCPTKPFAIGNPESLWNGCREYFLWAENHPLSTTKVMSSKNAKKGFVRVPVSKRRALSVERLCQWLGISKNVWYAMSRKQEYAFVCRAAMDHIWSHNFEAAGAGLLNPLIITRQLALQGDTGLSGNDAHYGEGGALGGFEGGKLDLSKLDVEDLKDLSNLVKKATKKEEKE